VCGDVERGGCAQAYRNDGGEAHPACRPDVEWMTRAVDARITPLYESSGCCGETPTQCTLFSSAVPLDIATPHETVARHRRAPIDTGVAAVDGPGSLLNFQGHPVDRLTSDRDVTYPSADAWETHSHRNGTQTGPAESPAVANLSRISCKSLAWD
jgi:hypothetical protein